MYEYLLRVSIYDIVPLALNCIIAFTVGIIFSIFPDVVQEWQIGMKDRPGRMGSWLGRHYPFYNSEDRFVRTGAYLTFIQVMGFICMLLAGIMTGFLVTYILRT